MRITFQLFGALQVETDAGGVRLGRRQERAVLAALLLHPSSVVSVGRLCELVWDGDPPGNAARLLHTPITRIRRAFAAAGHPNLLVSHPGGYSARVDPDAVDVHRFRGLINRAYAHHDAAARADLLRAALGLWRGPLLHDAAGERFRRSLGADLESVRLTALEDWLTAEVQLGRHLQALPHLARSVAEHPGSERLAELHMCALHRTGRTAEALHAYARIRHRLADDLGLDPGPELRRLHLSLLRS